MATCPSVKRLGQYHCTLKVNVSIQSTPVLWAALHPVRKVDKLPRVTEIQVFNSLEVKKSRPPTTSIELIQKVLKDLSRLLQVGDKGIANGFSRYNS